MKKIFLLLTTLVINIPNTYPCSSIVLKKGSETLLAKNFDWTFRDGILIKNLREINKVSYYTHAGEQAQWTSKYGSVTFNQNGKEMPYGGMNEKGLVVEMLWMELTKYNISDDKKYVNELEWIQYQLDNYETIKQVIEHLNDLQVYPVKGKIHYILADYTGESVIIEYLNGIPTTYQKEANTCQAITNNSVFHSEPFKNQIKGIRKNNTAPTYRYYQLEQEISNIDSKSEINESYAFDILKKVAIPKGNFKTMWSIVYNINQKRISFFTDTHKEIKTISISDLDFSNKLTYFILNQNDVKYPERVLNELTESINYSFGSPSLMHLGFDENVTKELSLHQFQQTQKTSSLFSNNYFHFEISIPIEQEKQIGFIAVMDNEDNFNKRQAVAGGFIYGAFGKSIVVVHVYGLKNGTYSMLAFIDSIKNSKLDFGKNGRALEKYASFSNSIFTNERQINFSSTSADFTKTNSKVIVAWK